MLMLLYSVLVYTVQYWQVESCEIWMGWKIDPSATNVQLQLFIFETFSAPPSPMHRTEI